jgi:hypothetical protein
VVQFLRASFACETPDQLADELIVALKHYGLDGLLDLHLPGHCCYVSSEGECTQLERSILAHVRNMERLFQFHDRLVVNYPFITLVVSKLPIADADQVGRLRDNLAILAEGANARLMALGSETARLTQSNGIRHALVDLSAALDAVEKQQEAQRLKALVAMDQYILDMEHLFVRLGLTEEQEGSLSDMARQTAENIGTLLGDDKAVSDQLHGVAVQLRKLVTP